MAIVKFERRQCDRCRISAEIPDDDVSRLWITGSFSGSAGIPSRFDLCPDCRGDLITWWEQRAHNRPL